MLRGSAVLIHSMMLGVKALNFSAAVAFEDQVDEEAKPGGPSSGGGGRVVAPLTQSNLRVASRDRRVVEKPSKYESSGAAATAAGSIAFALVFNILLFIALPLLLTIFFSSTSAGATRRGST